MAPPSTEKLQEGQDVTAVLVKLSQLRALFLQLPHLGTPRERAELEEFREYGRTAGRLVGARESAVRTGFRMAYLRLTETRIHRTATRSRRG